jgi:hypothetical protein
VPEAMVGTGPSRHQPHRRVLPSSHKHHHHHHSWLPDLNTFTASEDVEELSSSTRDHHDKEDGGRALTGASSWSHV